MQDRREEMEELICATRHAERILSASGEAVEVAVIDSGVEADHEEIARTGGLSGGVSISIEEGRTTSHPCDGRDLAGHGTACAGIIRRIAPKCKLYSVRVLDETGSGKLDRLLAGIEWCLEHNIKVMNLSLGITKLTSENVLIFYKLVHRAYFQGNILVCASSNNTGRSLPSCLAPVISVQATAENTLRYRDNEEIPFATRGIYVRVPWLQNSYQMMTGDSFSAPMVTGLVAKIVSLLPELSFFHVKTILWALAHDDEMMKQIISRGTRCSKEKSASSPS